MHLVAPSNTLLNNGLLFNKVFAEIIVCAKKRKFLDDKRQKYLSFVSQLLNKFKKKIFNKEFIKLILAARAKLEAFVISKKLIFAKVLLY